MSLPTESTNLLSNEHFKSNGYSNGHLLQIQQPQSQQGYSHCIDVLEKPLYDGYALIHAEDDFSAGLSLEELLPFVDDPWWQKLRRTIFCTFCLVFWLILITACTMAYMQIDKPCITTIAVTPITTTPAVGVFQRS
ncbi:uncharacterized protein LOC128855182 [Anastrepha ludens]|uniref:uncharacterized protein LOC128855182 n=1 Tax=Anastrepha ludens TaxID=28586 RepID=UPI0023AF7967|nr:uncharacterized protein LOC128855182 [Anastrepha ludens]